MSLQKETESDQKTHAPESEKKFSTEINGSSESKKKRSHGEITDRESHETLVEIALLSKRSLTWEEKAASEEEDGSSWRERLKRQRVEMAGRVWIPDIWGQEDFLKDWIDCSAFEASLVNSSIMSARDSLVEEGRRANAIAIRLRLQNGC
ncbi:hypothetical protein OROGR_017679 [Orobanche gracilis]